MSEEDRWQAGDLVALRGWGGNVYEFVVIKTVAGNGYLLKSRSWPHTHHFVQTFSDGRPMHDSWVVLQRPYKPRDYKLIFSIIVFVVTMLVLVLVLVLVLLTSMKR